MIKSVAIVTGLRYVKVVIGADRDSLSIDPLYAKIGVAFRWGGNQRLARP